MISMVFLAIHVLTSILDTYVHIGWASILVPFTSSYSRFWVGMGTVAFDLLAAVFVSSLLRSRMKPGTWRGIHWLAYGCWPIALAHTFGMGTDSGEPWVIVLGAACVLAVGIALLWSGSGHHPTGRCTFGGQSREHSGRSGSGDLIGEGSPPWAMTCARRQRTTRCTTFSVIRLIWPDTSKPTARSPLPWGAMTSWQGALTANLESSGLTGRGGGGFPSAAKLALASSHGDGGTLVVNGMEGEPASDKDKVLLTRAPHLVLDGAQFLAAMCRARRIVVCIPVGRDAVAAAVQHAIEERNAARYARVSELVVRPPDRFVAGEESALASWIDVAACAPRLPARQGHAVAHREATGSGAQRRDAGARRTHRPQRPRAVLGPWYGRRTRDVSRHRRRCGGAARGRRGRSWDSSAGHRRTWDPRSSRLRPSSSGVTAGPGSDPSTSTRPTRPFRCGPSVPAPESASIAVLGEHSCGVAETARIARYLAGQSSGQCGPCVFGLPAIADDLALSGPRTRPISGLMSRLQRRLGEVNGRGACRHPDGAVSLVRSALSVFGHDVSAHDKRRTVRAVAQTLVLPFPRPIGAVT